MRAPAPFLLLVLAGCAPGDDAPEPSADLVAAALTLSTSWRMIPIDSAAPVRIDAVVLDADGQALDVPVTWTVQDPSVVRVNDEGELVAEGVLGSSVVSASYGELEASALVYVARPSPEAVLVEDDQILSPVERIDDGGDSIESMRFAATLDQVRPSVGDLLIGVEQGLGAAKVTAVHDAAAGTRVELSVAPPEEAFADLALSSPGMGWVRFPEESGLSFAVGKLSLGTTDCKLGSSTDVSMLSVTRTEFDVEHALSTTFDVQIRAFSVRSAEMIVEGELGIEADFRAKLADDVQAKVDCGTPTPLYGVFPLPPALGGPFIQGYVPISAGVELSARAYGQGPEVGARLEATVEVVAGIRYDGTDFSNPSGFEADWEIAPVYDLASEDDRLQIDLYPYVQVGVGPGVPTVPRPKWFSLVEAKVGPKLSVDLADPVYQVEQTDYRSEAKVDLAWSVGPAGDVEAVLKKHASALHWLLGRFASNLSAVATYEDSTALWATPGGELRLTTVPPTAGGTVEAKVTLDGSAGWDTPFGELYLVDEIVLQHFDTEAKRLHELGVDAPASTSDAEFAVSGDLGAGVDPIGVYAAFARTSLVETPLLLDTADLRCAPVRLVVDELVLPADAPLDGVDADEAVYAHYELITALAGHYGALRDQAYREGQTSLGGYYATVVNNLADEAVREASFYASLRDGRQALMRLDGGAESDDFEGDADDFEGGLLEAGWIPSGAEPAWDAMPERSATHGWLYAPTLDDTYPLLAMIRWRAARVIGGDAVWLRARSFQGVAAYARTPATLSFRLDGEVYASGTTSTLPSMQAAHRLSLDEPHTLTVSFEAPGYDAGNYPSLDETGTVSGTALRMTFHLEEAEGACPQAE